MPQAVATGSVAGPARRRIVLCGAGHAHVHVAANAARLRARGIDVTLVAPGDLWYSGMAAGVLGCRYPLRATHFDPELLIRGQGGSFVRTKAVGLDRQARIVRLACGGSLPFDVVSFNVGSEVDLGSLGPLSATTRAVKPIQGLLHLRAEIEQPHSASGPPTRIVVVGGGPTGIEVAANLAHATTGKRDSVAVTLLARGDGLLPGRGRGAALTAMAALRRRGVDVRTNAEVIRIHPFVAILATGAPIAFDFLVLATGLRPATMMGELGLPVGSDGGLLVDDQLRSLADPRAFGAGDCITMAGRTLPRIGVFGVRQGPVLLNNLEAALTGAKLHPYVPQTHYLSIVNLGAGEGLALWGRFYWRSRLCMRLKDWLDARWVRRYRVLHDDSPTATAFFDATKPDIVIPERENAHGPSRATRI